jgi:hypothetical protein
MISEHMKKWQHIFKGVLKNKTGSFLQENLEYAQSVYEILKNLNDLSTNKNCLI